MFPEKISVPPAVVPTESVYCVTQFPEVHWKATIEPERVEPLPGLVIAAGLPLVQFAPPLKAF